MLSDGLRPVPKYTIQRKRWKLSAGLYVPPGHKNCDDVATAFDIVVGSSSLRELAWRSWVRMPSRHAMKEYYDRRATEYDNWYLGTGLYADCQRPAWNEELWELERVVANLPPARTLDVACGTGFLTRFLRGEVGELDQSERMVELASWRVPGGRFVVGDALTLPFESGSFERILTGHFYGHLDAGERKLFLTEARRVADEIVVVDSALREGVEPEEREERVLSDGSRHEVYKRYFDSETLARELGRAERSCRAPGSSR